MGMNFVITTRVIVQINLRTQTNSTNQPITSLQHVACDNELITFLLSLRRLPVQHLTPTTRIHINSEERD